MSEPEIMALLLGGVGVASAVNVFAKEKLPIAAILRCLGATQRTVFAIYLLQAAVMGFAGAAVGVASLPMTAAAEVEAVCEIA